MHSETFQVFSSLQSSLLRTFPSLHSPPAFTSAIVKIKVPPSLRAHCFSCDWLNGLLGSVNLVLASAPPRNNLLFYTNYHMKAANVVLLQLCFMFQNCKWHHAVHICPFSGNNPSPSSPFLLLFCPTFQWKNSPLSFSKVILSLQ